MSPVWWIGSRPAAWWRGAKTTGIAALIAWFSRQPAGNSSGRFFPIITRQRSGSGAGFPPAAPTNWWEASQLGAPTRRGLPATSPAPTHERLPCPFSGAGDPGGARRAPRTTGPAACPGPGRRRGGGVSPGLCLLLARFPDRGLPLLPFSTGPPADGATGILHRAGHRLRDLRAAPGVFLADLRLAVGGALVGAGVLARPVRRAGQRVPEAIGVAGGVVGALGVDRSRIFPERTLLSAVLLAGSGLCLFKFATNLHRDPSRHVRCGFRVDAVGRRPLEARPEEIGRASCR